MNLEQKEKIIRILVAEVLNKLIYSGKNSNDKSYNHKLDSWHTEKNLITGNDAESAVGKGYKKIFVSSKTIITPLARDIIKEKGIVIVKSDNEKKDCEKEIFCKTNKNKIAILSNHDDEAYKFKTKQILQKHDIEVDCLSPKNFTTSELQIAVNNLSESILQGKYYSGVVISHDSYQLMKSQKKISGLKANICWEIDGDKGCTAKSNLLYINSSLIGFKKLEGKLNTWIHINKPKCNN